MISLPFETGLHQAGVSHDQDRAGTDEPEEGTKGCGDPEKRDTCGSVMPKPGQLSSRDISCCTTLALTDNKETGVERFLSYDMVPDLHRLRCCT